MNQELKENVQQPQSPIKNKIGTVFIPVTNIERSRDWYCSLLGLPEGGEILHGHLYPLPMEGASIVLDTMPMWGGQEPGGAPPITTPSVMLLTVDLEAAYAFAQQNGITLVTDIQHNHWFVIQDPDNNKLMICRE